MLKVDDLSVILIGMFRVTKIVSKYTFLFKKKKIVILSNSSKTRCLGVKG
jgi:hypothetical protein